MTLSAPLAPRLRRDGSRAGGPFMDFSAATEGGCDPSHTAPAWTSAYPFGAPQLFAGFANRARVVLMDLRSWTNRRAGRPVCTSVPRREVWLSSRKSGNGGTAGLAGRERRRCVRRIRDGIRGAEEIRKPREARTLAVPARVRHPEGYVSNEPQPGAKRER